MPISAGQAPFPRAAVTNTSTTLLSSSPPLGTTLHSYLLTGAPAASQGLPRPPLAPTGLCSVAGGASDYPTGVLYVY